MSSKYTDLLPGVWFTPSKVGFKFCCCTCGLIHLVQIRVFKNKVQIRMLGDSRSTGQYRRFHHIKVKEIPVK